MVVRGNFTAFIRLQLIVLGFLGRTLFAADRLLGAYLRKLFPVPICEVRLALSQFVGSAEAGRRHQTWCDSGSGIRTQSIS